jgi:hypothetical protein
MKMRLLTITVVTLLLFAAQSKLACADPVPCTCLQELWVDYPGPYDLYFSLDHMISCDDVGEEGIWYGSPSNSTLPQICADNDCEPYEGPEERASASIPGHGQELVGVKAWDVFRVGLESATRKMPGLEFGSPSYLIIPRKNLPAKLKAVHDMIVMAIPINVHIKGSPFDGNSYYFCVQIDSADGLQISKATFEDVKLGRGSQLHLKMRSKNGEVRKALVWLK